MFFTLFLSHSINNPTSGRWVASISMDDLFRNRHNAQVGDEPIEMAEGVLVAIHVPLQGMVVGVVLVLLLKVKHRIRGTTLERKWNGLRKILELKWVQLIPVHPWLP